MRRRGNAECLNHIISVTTTVMMGSLYRLRWIRCLPSVPTKCPQQLPVEALRYDIHYILNLRIVGWYVCTYMYMCNSIIVTLIWHLNDCGLSMIFVVLVDVSILSGAKTEWSKLNGCGAWVRAWVCVETYLKERNYSNTRSYFVLNPCGCVRIFPVHWEFEM